MCSRGYLYQIQPELLLIKNCKKVQRIILIKDVRIWQKVKMTRHIWMFHKMEYYSEHSNIEVLTSSMRATTCSLLLRSP